MAKVKVVNTNLDYNLNRESFNNTPSQTLFSFGKFKLTSNFDGRRFIDYSNQLSTFVTPITLETLKLTDKQSEIVNKKSKKLELNLDKSKFDDFVRFGSAYEFLRVGVEEIILNYPASIYLNSQKTRGGNTTFFDFQYNNILNESTFKVPINAIDNNFNIVMVDGDLNKPNNDELRNLNLSYDDYVIWLPSSITNHKTKIIGFTGNSKNVFYLTIKTKGNPFEEILPTTVEFESVDFHIKPNNIKFEEFREQLNEYQKYMLSTQDNNEGFIFDIKEPILLDDGNIDFSKNQLKWNTSDGYNIDFNTSRYRTFLESLLTIGSKYDSIKTDLIARFLTVSSLKTYDLTENGKINKLLRIYGWEFDRLRQFVDSLVYVNKLSYDKISNAPDKIISNLAKTFGWDHFSLISENDLVNNLLIIDDDERDLNKDFLPAEIDLELWRRILVNVNYFWKSKGTREAIRSIFLLIGIPYPFINITEYVYTVDGKIDPRQSRLSAVDYPSNSLPYDMNGYPKAPIETSDFYFQLSGNTDSGQAYMDIFRNAGFDLKRTMDNKKSWVQTGSTIRRHPSTIQYYQEDSKLVLNTKEVDIAIDTARAIEYDVYNYIQKDFKVTSTGYTMPYSFVNISLDFDGTENTFPLPSTYDSNKTKGDLEVRFNGILLNAPKEFDEDNIISGGTEIDSDYIIDPTTKTFTIINDNYAENTQNRRDVIQATFIYSGGTVPISGVSVQYVVTRVKITPSTAIVKLPSKSSGHIQLTINGIALTRKTNQYNGDYTINSNDTSEIIITNQDVIAHIATNPYIQVAYIEVDGSDTIEAKNEVHRIDSFNSSKFFFNLMANKFVYRLNYKVNDINSVKILIDGIGLEPKKDYMFNPDNPYEIYLPKGLKYGSVISAYYLIGGDEFLDTIIEESFGLGDISHLSFLEFLELIQTRMINAKNRKTITDYKGGWYPTLLKIYNKYLSRANLEDNSPLQSNGYTFENLFPFLMKYNAFFEKFIYQLLSSTIILRKSGILVRNTIFNKQKYTYKRGVSYYIKIETPIFNTTLNYYGDDGSMFVIPQEDIEPPPEPTLKTKKHGNVTENSVINVGGEDITMFDDINEFGMRYRKSDEIEWIYSPEEPYTKNSQDITITSDGFQNHNILNLEPNTTYEYKAYVIYNGVRYVGNIETVTTDEEVEEPTPILNTKGADSSSEDTIFNVGGEDITMFYDINEFGMEYTEDGTGVWNNSPEQPYHKNILPDHIEIGNNYFYGHDLSDLKQDTTYRYRSYVIYNGVRYYGSIKQKKTKQKKLNLNVNVNEDTE